MWLESAQRLLRAHFAASELLRSTSGSTKSNTFRQLCKEALRIDSLSACCAFLRCQVSPGPAPCSPDPPFPHQPRSPPAAFTCNWHGVPLLAEPPLPRESPPRDTQTGYPHGDEQAAECVASPDSVKPLLKAAHLGLPKCIFNGLELGLGFGRLCRQLCLCRGTFNAAKVLGRTANHSAVVG